MRKKLKVLDLFAGCGGISVGFEQAGFNVIAANDVWKVALKTMFRLRKEIPDKLLTVKIGSIDEQKKNKFKRWFEVKNK